MSTCQPFFIFPVELQVRQGLAVDVLPLAATCSDGQGMGRWGQVRDNPGGMSRPCVGVYLVDHVVLGRTYARRFERPPDKVFFL